MSSTLRQSCKISKRSRTTSGDRHRTSTLHAWRKRRLPFELCQVLVEGTAADRIGERPTLQTGSLTPLEPTYQQHRSGASRRYALDARAMSAMPPRATKLMHHNEPSLCADIVL